MPKRAVWGRHAHRILSVEVCVPFPISIGTAPAHPLSRHNYDDERLSAMISTQFEIKTCRPCGKLFWEGRVWGFNTKLDIEPMTIYQEIMAKLYKTQRTYLLHRTSKSFEATPRIGAYINDTENPVLGSHICDPSQFQFGQTPPEDYWGRFQYKQNTGEGVPF